MLSAQSSKCCLETVGVRMKIQLFVMGDFTTLYNVCAVPWGVFSTVGISWVPWGDILSTVGWYLEYRGVFSTVGDIMSTLGGYLEYRGGCSVLWGVSWCMWGISWVPWRVFSTAGGNLLLFEYPTVLNTPTVLMISPTCIMISPHGTQISKDGILHGTEHPPRYSWYRPRASWCLSTVLNIPHGTQDNPHGTQDIPHGTHDIPLRH